MGSKDVAPIRVLVLDDHDVVRYSVVSLIEREPDMEVVGQSRSAQDALALHRSLKPDVTLVDLRLYGMSGTEFIIRARQDAPDARFVVLTASESDDDIERAFAAGARAYVLKLGVNAEILAAVRGVHRSGAIIFPDLARRRRRKDRERSPRLSPREIEILNCVARGENNGNIGTALGVGHGTVKTHLRRIFLKLAVGDRDAAVSTARTQGLMGM